MPLVLLYVVLAAIATAVNVGSQMFLVAWLPDAIMASILLGTAAGLVCKYWLDKRYIFRFRAADRTEDGRVFVLYTAMGVFTTFIFWGIELLFHMVFESDAMRYVGAILGLGIGYVVKYRLDKRYVFIGSRACRT